MKVTELSDKALRFENENLDLKLLDESGVYYRIVEYFGALRVMIEVGETTTSDQIRQAIPQALIWRNRLLDWQGAWEAADDYTFIANLLYEFHDKRGLTYSEISQSINQKASEYISVSKGKKINSHKQSAIKDRLDWLLRKPSPSNGIDNARLLLRALRINEDEIDVLLNEAIRNIDQGREPFPEGYPVDKDKVRSIIRWWKVKNRGG